MAKIKTYGDLTERLKDPIERIPTLASSPEKSRCQELIGPIRNGLQELVDGGETLSADLVLPPNIVEAYEEFEDVYQQFRQE